MGTKGICSWVLINRLNRPLIDTSRTSQSTLDQHLQWYLVNTWSTSWLTVRWESTNFRRHTLKCWLKKMSRPTLCQLLIECQSSVNGDVDQMSMEMSIKCQASVGCVSGCRSKCRSSVNQDVDGESIKGHSRASVYTWLQMPLLHMIMKAMCSIREGLLRWHEIWRPFLCLKFVIKNFFCGD